VTDRPSFDPTDEVVRILASIVESSADAIISMDLSGIVVTWNRGAERMFGYAAGEVVGRSLEFLFPEHLETERETILARMRSGDRILGLETVRRAKDGHLVDVSLTVSAIRDAGGHVVGASTIARDITDQKRTEHALRTSEARWRAVIDCAVDAIVVIDAHGRIEAFNPAAERLFGFAEGEVVGSNVNVLMPSPYHEEHDGYLSRYLATGDRRIIGIGREVTARHRDGATFPVQLAVGEMTVDGERKFTGIIYDLRARMAMEERLREQTAMARLGEMAAVVAHEIKNPLAGIRGAVQVIGGRLPAKSPDAAVAKEIVARIDGLNELMKDLLLFARPPKPRLAPVDLTGLIAATANLLGEDPSARGVQVEVVGTAPLAMADAELLKIVFLNLLMNGAHVARGRGPIRVSITSADDWCQIAFSDPGPGIPSEILDKVFTPFFTTKSRGTGLGLPTAKQLVEAHGGTMRIECPPGGGTTVIVQLPVHPGQVTPEV
jgi:two-component system sensor kinase FixL